MAKIKEHIKQNWWKYLIIICVLAVDMLTKFLLVPLDANNQVDFSKAKTASLLGDLLWLYPSVNDGAGWSFLSGHTVLLIVLSIIFIIALTVFDFVKPQKSKLYKVAIALIFGGAVGNLVDRLAFGGNVRDFIYFKFINFPVFNVADMALTFGIICLLVWLIFFQGKNQKTENEDAEAGKQKIEKVENFDDTQKSQTLDNADGQKADGENV